jgi:hypothetical protein
MLTTPKVSIPALKETTDAMAQGDHQMCPHTLPQRRRGRFTFERIAHLIRVHWGRRRSTFSYRWLTTEDLDRLVADRERVSRTINYRSLEVGG